MARMAVLVPFEELCGAVEEMFAEHPAITRHSVEAIPNVLVPQRVRALEREGCDIIMARGLQASIARNEASLPVVEIRAAPQEVMELALDIRDELQEPSPPIGLIGAEFMLCDTSGFERLIQIPIRRYIVHGTGDIVEETADLVRQAMVDGCRAVIGGRVSCSEATKRGLCCRFLNAGKVSLRLAFNMALHIAYAIDQEKQSRAELETMLNFTSGGIVRVDRRGVVLWASALACELLGVSAEQLLRHPLTEAFPALGAEQLDKVLTDREEVYTMLVPPNRKATVVNMSPIEVDGAVTGAILTVHEGRRIMEMNSELRKELYTQGHLADWRFSDLPAESAASKALVKRARQAARYHAPILIQGPVGSGKEALAQCIHNEGVTKGNAFIPLDCRAYQPDTLDTMLFGNYTTRKDTSASLVEIAQNGTLYLAHVDALSPELQYKLMRLVRGLFTHNGSNRVVEVNVRIIASADADLYARVAAEAFRSDLYYALNALGLELRPLSQRREDILGWVDIFLSAWEKQYDRRVHLTQNARAFLEAYDWPGNLDQVNSVCEQIVLLSERNSIDETFLRRQIRQLTPQTLPGTQQLVVFKDERAVRIAALLREYGGNRQKVADALGVSKTTLWRYMNKYGIGKDFDY